VLRREGLIGKSARRERRPTSKELWVLSQYFGLHRSIPMLHIMFFAIFSCRRQSEITRLRWDDINNENRTCLMRDMKHPTIKHFSKRFKLSRSAYKIIQRQARQSEFIFPYNSKTIGHYFRKACKFNDIIDLRFHDLRHEGVSRLFEAGFSIAEVQKISLHSTWDSLSRYTNIDPGDIDV
jgi:integrase